MMTRYVAFPHMIRRRSVVDTPSKPLFSASRRKWAAKDVRAEHDHSVVQGEDKEIGARAEFLTHGQTNIPFFSREKSKERYVMCRSLGNVQVRSETEFRALTDCITPLTRPLPLLSFLISTCHVVQEDRGIDNPNRVFSNCRDGR